MTITARRDDRCRRLQWTRGISMKEAEQGVHGTINTCATERTQLRRSKKSECEGSGRIDRPGRRAAAG